MTTGTTTTGTTTTSRLIHAAFFYQGDDDYLDTLMPFIREGVDHDEPVLVAVPSGKLELLRRALGADLPGVTLSDMATVGGNPARTFTVFADAAAAAPGTRLRMIGEPVWPGRPADAYPACVENETLWNTAFANYDVVTLCPYDAARLSAPVLADARATHPLIWNDGEAVGNAEYEGEHALARCHEELWTDPAAARFGVHAPADLGPARAFALAQARALGLPADRMADLQLIVGELTTNSLRYTCGGCTLALWATSHGLVCEVRDGGRLDDPLAGRRSAPPHSPGGRGLLLVNAMADLVRIQRMPDATVIQAHLYFERQEIRS